MTRHAELLAAKGIGFVDVRRQRRRLGPENGYALMVGGEAADVARVSRSSTRSSPRARTVSCTRAPVGAGHFAKMVHNGIEYGMMQAFAEGYELLAASTMLTDVAEVVQVLAAGDGHPVLAAGPDGRGRSSRTPA